MRFRSRGSRNAGDQVECGRDFRHQEKRFAEEGHSQKLVVVPYLVERDGFKPPRSQAVDLLRNAVPDQFCGFKDSEKIRFSGTIQAPVG